MKHFNIYILLFILIISSCSNNLEIMPSVYVSENQPDITILNLKTRYNANEQLKAKVIAPIVNNFEKIDNPYSEFPKGVKVYFYDEDFKLTSSLISDYAIYYTKQQLWKASGNVVITNSEGATLKTQEIYGDENTNKIYSMKYIELTEPNGYVLNGKDGFESNINFHPYIIKNVDGIITDYENSIK